MKEHPDRRPVPPIFANKDYGAPSVFRPENLLREARRQKALRAECVPTVCVLDPDGDIVQTLISTGDGQPDRSWACYHTSLYRFRRDGLEFGIIGCAVGAAFAVLVAEELFACGCRLLISMTSAGQLRPVHAPPYFILIEKALRDEGTSYHYQPPAQFSAAEPSLVARVGRAMTGLSIPVVHGATWTTDAPFRETAAAIDAGKALGLLAVEMEAAALYAFAAACGKAVICFAHVTNQMGQIEGDFEKGADNGAESALAVIAAAAGA